MTKLAYFGQQYTQDVFEASPVSRDPILTSDLDLTISLDIGFEQPNFINQTDILNIRALSAGIVEAVPIPIRSKCTIPNLIGENKVLQVVDSDSSKEIVYVPTNNNLIVDLVVLNQDNYLDEIPTIVSGTPVQTPFWS